MVVSSQVYETLAPLVRNRRRYIETFMKIEDKERNLVPFNLNPVQATFHENQTGRDIILKASQLGFTSIVAADFLTDTITHPGTVSVIVAHEEFITQRLLEKAQKFYDSIPNELKPEMHHASAYEKSFPDIGSVFYIGSARQFVFGRGETIHNFLGSEVAFWPDPEKILVPTMQRVPITGRIILESTPNGEGNYFHTAVTKAKKGEATDTGIFKLHTFPWWLCAEYQLPRGSPYALKRDVGELHYTDEEMALIERVGLSEDQIRWRRRKVQEMEDLHASGETRLMFYQEYLEDDESCFLVSGESVYDQYRLKELGEGCYPAPGGWKGFGVWHKPKSGANYVVAVDPGQASNTKTALTVWQAVDNKDRSFMRHCATKKGLIPTDRTAVEAMDVAEYYNHALLAVEANGHGLAVTNAIGNYRRLYRRTDIETGQQNIRIGWLTTSRTKPFMVSELQNALLDMECADINIIQQLRNARWKTNNTIEFMGEDDLHDSAAIAVVCRPDKPIRKGLVGQVGRRTW